MPVISDLHAVNDYFHVSDDMIYTAGKNSLTVKRSDGSIDIGYGNFTFVWTKQSDNSFAIEMIHIESVHKK